MATVNLNKAVGSYFLSGAGAFMFGSLDPVRSSAPLEWVFGSPRHDGFSLELKGAVDRAARRAARRADTRLKRY